MHLIHVLVSVCLLTSWLGLGAEGQAPTRRPMIQIPTQPARSSFFRDPRAVLSEQIRDRLEQERYKGLTVKPQSGAEGDMLNLQNRIAALLSRADFVPAARVERLRWIPESGVRITGWLGYIQEVKPSTQGTLVRMRVCPRLDCNGGLNMGDYTIETYLYADGLLHCLKVEGALEKGVISFN